MKPTDEQVIRVYKSAMQWYASRVERGGRQSDFLKRHPEHELWAACAAARKGKKHG